MKNQESILIVQTAKQGELWSKYTIYLLRTPPSRSINNVTDRSYQAMWAPHQGNRDCVHGADQLNVAQQTPDNAGMQVVDMYRSTPNSTFKRQTTET